jgi:hypothetical protein
LVEDEFISQLIEWMRNNPITDEDRNQEHISVPPSMNEDTKKTLSEYWKNYWSDKRYPDHLREKISKSLKGRKFSVEHLRRKSEAQKRKVMINDVTYDSGRDAAKALGISPACVVKWTKNGKAHYIE